MQGNDAPVTVRVDGLEKSREDNEKGAKPGRGDLSVRFMTRQAGPAGVEPQGPTRGVALEAASR